MSGGFATDGEGGCSSLGDAPSPDHLAAAQSRATRAAETLSRLTHQLSKTLTAPIQSAAAPSITPDLAHTPSTLAQTIAHDLRHALDIAPATRTAMALATPELLAQNDIESLMDLIEPHLGLPEDAHISAPEHHNPPGYEDACQILIAHPSRPYPLRLDFFKRPGEPWLLDHIDTG